MDGAIEQLIKDYEKKFRDGVACRKYERDGKVVPVPHSYTDGFVEWIAKQLIYFKEL